LIDFELASWTLTDETGNPHRYKLNSEENKYCGSDTVFTGAYDAILLLTSSVYATKNPEIQEYCMSRLQSFSFKKNKTDYLEWTKDLFLKNSNRWIYRLLKDTEDSLPQEERKMVHEFNIEQLRYWTMHQIKGIL
jgi:hypothetical protein